MTAKPLHIALLAGETSGDLLGAPLLAALRERLPNARFSGVGGAAMQAAGLDSLIDMNRLAVMGLVEVLRHLPDILAAQKSLLAHWAGDPPDVFIGIDAPDFNLRIAKVLHARGVKTVHYVSPSLWAWKEKRIHKIRRCIDLMLCLFPFETAVYDKHGVPAVCVGHPLRDRLQPVAASDARAALALPQDVPILGIFPGSRRGEIRRLLPDFLHTYQRLKADNPALHAVLSLRHPPDEASAALLARLPALQINGQRRAVAQVGRHVAISEADIGGQAGFDAVSVLQHHAVVVGEHCRLLARFLAIRRIGADGGNTLADVFAQERLRAQEVVIKILLQQLQRRAAARDKARRFRHDARGNIAQGNAVRPRIQRQFARLAHQGEIVVINGDGDRLAVFAFADGFRDFGESGMAGGEGKRGGDSGFTGHDDS